MLSLDKGNRGSYNENMRLRLNRKQSKQMQGHPLTTQRRLLLELIRDAMGHIDAKELYRRANSKDESISLATVYRSLHLFKELGLVDERRLGQVRCYYEIKRTPEHQHLVCQGCGKIIEFESPLIRELVDKIQRNNRFNVTKAELYLEGYCEQCKEKTVPVDS
jgi:Fur family ferric uptake transcriptional regulator